MKMTHGELGCALSHILIYKKMINENIKSALILEDDALIESDVTNLIPIINNKLINDKKPKVILLNKTNEYFDVFKHKLNDEYSLVKVIDGVLAVGYIINNMAAKNLFNFLYPVRFKADEWRFFREKNIIKLYGVVPPLIKPSGVISSIGLRDFKLSPLDKLNQKKSFKEKIKLMLWRVFVRTWLKKVKP